VTPDQVIQAIETQLAAELSALQLNYLTEEETFSTDLQGDSLWVRSNIELGTVDEIEVGRIGASLRSGSLVLKIYAEPMKLRQVAKIAGDCEALLRRKPMGSIEFGEPETRSFHTPKLSRASMMVRCPFWVYQ